MCDVSRCVRGSQSAELKASSRQVDPGQPFHVFRLYTWTSMEEQEGRGGNS